VYKSVAPAQISVGAGQLTRILTRKSRTDPTTRYAVFFEVALLVLLGAVELDFGQNFDNGEPLWAIGLPQSLCHRLCGSLLFDILEKYDEATRGAEIRLPATECDRAMSPEEVIDQLFVGDLRRIERDPTPFEILEWRPRVADYGVSHPFDLSKCRFQAPETSPRKRHRLRGRSFRQHSSTGNPLDGSETDAKSRRYADRGHRHDEEFTIHARLNCPQFTILRIPSSSRSCK